MAVHHLQRYRVPTSCPGNVQCFAAVYLVDIDSFKDRRDAQEHEAAKHAKLVLDEFIEVCRTVYVESMASQRFLSDF
jgi:hypothetical protein